MKDKCYTESTILNNLHKLNDTIHKSAERKEGMKDREIQTAGVNSR